MAVAHMTILVLLSQVPGIELHDENPRLNLIGCI